MPDQPQPLKQFSTAQTAKLLGLLIRELKELQRVGRGPVCEGWDEYVSYREDRIKLWAIQHVHAPLPWFDRFEDPDPRRVFRCYIVNNGKHYVLSWPDEARMLRVAADRCTRDKSRSGACQLYRADAPAFRAEGAKPTIFRTLAGRPPIEQTPT